MLASLIFEIVESMAEKAFTTADYKLFPSPRNVHAEVFMHQVFVPYPYTLIDLPSFYFNGKASLFAACRMADRKMGQLVTFDQDIDLAKFNDRFVPD
jgi:hypothetical protein